MRTFAPMMKTMERSTMHAVLVMMVAVDAAACFLRFAVPVLIAYAICERVIKTGAPRPAIGLGAPYLLSQINESPTVF